MRIAVLVEKFPVISETFILNQITGLIDRGHEVDIYALYRGDFRQVHPEVIRYRLLERVQYPPLFPDNRALRLMKAVGLIIRNVWDRPAPMVRALNVGRYGRTALSLRLLYEIVPLVGKSYDVIHAQFGPLGLIALTYREMGAISGKLITHFRGYDISKFVRREGTKVYERLFAEGDLFLANCDFFKRKAIEIGCPPEKIVVHRSGVDLKSFQLRNGNGRKHAALQAITVGRLTGKKGLEFGIQAIAKVLKRGYAIEYTIVGEGHLRGDLETLAREQGIADRVHFLGWKDKNEVIRLLNEADIFIASSCTSDDGDQDAPVNTLKEAMALGLPVIATNHGGIPELVEDGISGLLVPERDADALADRLSYLIEHPELWEAMGKVGRERVVAEYDINKLNDRLVDLYRDLVKG